MKSRKTVCILGAGAMGCLYGSALLGDPLLEVFFVVRSPEKASLLGQQGFLLTDAGREQRYKVKCVLSGKADIQPDYVLVFVKAHETASAYRENAALFGENTKVLTLQNGLGGSLFLQEKIAPALFAAGISNHNSTVLAPGKILHGGSGSTLIGSFSPEGISCAEEFVSLFEKTSLKAEYTPDVRRVIWEKLMVNLAINPVTALHQVRNGQIPLRSSLAEEASALVREAILVAEKEGIIFDEEQVLSHVFDVARATASGYSSMLQDRLQGKKTEIDAINGAIVRLAEKYKTDVPRNKRIVAEIHALELED